MKQNAQRSAKELLGLLSVAEVKIIEHEVLINLLQLRIHSSIQSDSYEAAKDQLKPLCKTKDLAVLNTMLKAVTEEA